MICFKFYLLIIITRCRKPAFCGAGTKVFYVKIGIFHWLINTLLASQLVNVIYAFEWISYYLEVYFKMKVAIFCFKNCPPVLSFPLFQTMAAPRSFSANLVQLFCTADKDQHHLPMVNVFRAFVPFPPLKFEKNGWLTMTKYCIVWFLFSFHLFNASWRVDKLRLLLFIHLEDWDASSGSLAVRDKI